MSKKRSVLVVDDSVDTLRLMGLIFHRGGYEVYTARSGEEALTKVDTLHPHVMILDVMMPDMSGLDICRQIRANPATARLPIIMVSAKGLVDDRVSGLRAGADDYLPKPVDASELLARVNALLMRSDYAQKPTAHIVSVVGVKGGVGTTTTALNMASALTAQGRSVILAELRADAGTAGIHLDMSPLQDLGEILAEDVADFDPRKLLRQVARHSSGLRLLLAPQSPGRYALTPEHARLILDALAQEAEFLILDLSAATGEAMQQALSASDRILLVMEPEMLSVYCAHRLLALLKEQGVQSRSSIVLVSRAPSEVALPRGQVEKMLQLSSGRPEWPSSASEQKWRGTAIVAVIPPAAEPLQEALRVHEPLVLAMPNLVAAQSLSQLGKWVVEQVKTEA